MPSKQVGHHGTPSADCVLWIWDRFFQPLTATPNLLLIDAFLPGGMGDDVGEQMKSAIDFRRIRFVVLAQHMLMQV